MMATSQRSNDFNALLRRLREAGVSPKYVRETVLPEWWDASLESNPAGYAEAMSLIASHLGVPIRPLMSGESLSFSDGASVKFKRREGVAIEELAWARRIASYVARLVAEATPASPAPIPPAESIRWNLTLDKQPVTLERLVDYCWSIGVSVAFASQFPGKKMDGMCAKIGGRPVIVLSKRKKEHAWLAFVLAHELGHLALGHLDDDSFLVDDDNLVGEEGHIDIEESAANEFAVRTIFGSFSPPRSLPVWNPGYILGAAKRAGKEQSVDPGAIILSLGRSTKDWAMVSKALHIFDKTGNGPELVHSKMKAHIQTEKLPEEGAYFLDRVAGCVSN